MAAAAFRADRERLARGVGRVPDEAGPRDGEGSEARRERQLHELRQLHALELGRADSDGYARGYAQARADVAAETAARQARSARRRAAVASR